MTTNSYAISRTERLWMLFSITLLVAAIFYGYLASRVVMAMGNAELTTILQDFPVLLLTSMSVAFALTGAGHYAIRQTFVRGHREVAHD